MGYYNSHPSAAQMMIVIIVLIGYWSGTSDGAPYCSTVPVTDPTTFSGYADKLLRFLVDNTVSHPSLSGPTISLTTAIPNNQPGSAAGSSFCDFGVNGSTCTDCLASLVPYLQDCKAFTSGGAYYDGWCRIQFQQL